MSLYSQGVGAITATNAALDIKASATVGAKLHEMGFVVGAAVNAQLILGRPGNDGSVVQTGTTAFQPDDPADPAAQTNSAITWSTAPTVPTLIFRKFMTVGLIGAGVIYHFPRGISFAASRGLVLWNTAAGTATANVWMVIDE